MDKWIAFSEIWRNTSGTDEISHSAKAKESSWVYYTAHFIATTSDHSIISQCFKGYISCSLVQAGGQGHLIPLVINKQFPSTFIQATKVKT